MEWLTITIGIIIAICLILSWIGMWKINTDKMTDYDLYGMNAEEYLKKQVGEEYYEKHFKNK